MHYNVTSKYSSKAKVRYSDENAPLVDHEIVETYKGVDEAHLRTTLSTLMDVMEGVPEPTFKGKNGQSIDVPDNIKAEIVERYKKNYSKYEELCSRLESFCADTSKSEIIIEMGDESSEGSSSVEPSKETITVAKAV